MKYITSFIVFFFIHVCCFAQIIEGDRLLDLPGKSTKDPMFTLLKKQETFYTDAWDEDFTIYIGTDAGMIISVELQNGKLRYGSATERYGRYANTLPLQLKWTMDRAAFESKLGAPTLVSTKMNFSDYQSGNWQLRIFFEGDKPVSIEYKPRNKPAAAALVAASASTKIVTQPGANKPPAAVSTLPDVKAGSLIRLVNDNKAELDWELFKNMINNYKSLSKFAGTDSVDYIGEVYYSSLAKAEGFDRTAIKRRKRDNKWYFDAFIKIKNDDKKAANIFYAMYDGIKNTIKANVGDDFILASKGGDSIRNSPVNWMAMWTLYSGNKTFTPGLGKVQVVLLLSGLKSFMKENEMDYTLKLYICDPDVKIDFFTWDTPRN
jgi:hypothetical protein